MWITHFQNRKSSLGWKIGLVSQIPWSTVNAQSLGNTEESSVARELCVCIMEVSERQGSTKFFEDANSKIYHDFAALFHLFIA